MQNMFSVAYDIYFVNYLRFTKKLNTKISQKSQLSASSNFSIENKS